jgi:hypothetical protein
MVGFERIIASLAESAACPIKDVETLFAREYARLAATARVRTHLQTLVASNVRAMLRRARRAQRAA